MLAGPSSLLYELCPSRLLAAFGRFGPIITLACCRHISHFLVRGRPGRVGRQWWRWSFLLARVVCSPPSGFELAWRLAKFINAHSEHLATRWGVSLRGWCPLFSSSTSTSGRRRRRCHSTFWPTQRPGNLWLMLGSRCRRRCCSCGYCFLGENRRSQIGVYHFWQPSRCVFYYDLAIGMPARYLSVRVHTKKKQRIN